MNNIRLIQWDVDAWDEYCDWQKVNRSVVKRINQLVKDIKRNPLLLFLVGGIIVISWIGL